MKFALVALPFALLLAPISTTSASNTAALALRSASGQSPVVVTVGQKATIVVDLVDLAPGISVDSLAATVTFDGTLLGSPDIQIGEIVPSPLSDPLDLLKTADVGIADVAFLTLGTDSSDHLHSSGTFYSFDVTALQIGSGALHFAFAGATQFNPANPDSPIPMVTTLGPDLPFHVVAVPEPGNAVPCCLLASATFIFRRLR